MPFSGIHVDLDQLKDKQAHNSRLWWHWSHLFLLCDIKFILHSMLQKNPYGPPKYSRGIWLKVDNFNQTCRNLKGEISPSPLGRAHSRCSPFKGGNSLLMPIFELHVNLRTTQRKSNNIIQSDGNIRIMSAVISNNFYLILLRANLSVPFQVFTSEKEAVVLKALYFLWCPFRDYVSAYINLKMKHQPHNSRRWQHQSHLLLFDAIKQFVHSMPQENPT